MLTAMNPNPYERGNFISQGKLPHGPCWSIPAPTSLFSITSLHAFRSRDPGTKQRRRGQEEETVSWLNGNKGTQAQSFLPHGPTLPHRSQPLPSDCVLHCTPMPKDTILPPHAACLWEGSVLHPGYPITWSTSTPFWKLIKMIYWHRN